MPALTREQLEERLIALHQTSLELVRDLSLDPLLERIVRLAREQAGARYAALGMVDEEGNLKRFIPVGMNDEEVARVPHEPVGLGLIGAIQEERRTIRVPEIKEDPRSVGFPPNHPPMHSFLGVPILSGDRLLGQIYLTDKKGEPAFTEEDEHVIETLAAYASVAITNARLYEEMVARDEALKQRNEDLSLLNMLAGMLATSLEVDEILDQTLSRVVSYLKVEAGEIFLREDGGKDLRLALHRGEAAEAFWGKQSFFLGEGFIGRVAQLGEPLVSVSLETDTRFLRKAVVEAGFRSLACIPLMARRKVVGVMSVFSRRGRRFDARELDLLMAIGTWAGTAIENVRLHRQASRLAVLEERERIGMDLHDGIIQSVYGVGLALDYARSMVEEDPDQTREKISQAIDGLNDAIRDIRTYILDLRPRQLRGEETLIEGMRSLVEEFRVQTLAEVKLESEVNGLEDLPHENALALFHICREALANVAKHAQPQRTNVRLWSADDRVMLEVSDDGRGFDLRKMSFTLGHGLSNMHRRARKVGGNVEISSRPSEGTTVFAWVPWNHSEGVGGD